MSEAAALGIAALDVKCNDLLHSKLGASEKAVSALFAHARDHAPCVILLDQLDTLGVPRGNDTTTEGSLDRILGMLLMEIDGLKTGDQVSIVATCRTQPARLLQTQMCNVRNTVESLTDLDEALLRPGRLGTRLKLDIPDVTDRRAILHQKADEMSFDGSAHDFLNTLARKTSGLSGADLHALCHCAARHSLRERDRLSENRADFIGFAAGNPISNPKHKQKPQDGPALSINEGHLRSALLTRRATILDC